MGHYCNKCGKTMDDNQFYKSKRVDKYPPDGIIGTCKKCLTMHVDNWDPETYKWILEEMDVPYIKEEWDKLLEKYGKNPKKMTGTTIIGRYLSKMKLKQWKTFGWADTEALAEESRNRKITSMQSQGYTSEEIEEQLAIDRTPPKPKEIEEKQEAVDTPEWINPEDQEDEFSSQLTDEDKMNLRLKWGSGYKPSEWIKMEKLYRDMMSSYDIQTAGHKDTLIMICKASLRVNTLLDAGDIDDAQKMAKVYDSLMKSGRFTAAQNKEEVGDAVDSIGELVAICERDGFIPKYYIDKPNDKVDRVIQDMQVYTHDLVTEELGLGNLIENAVKSLEREREQIEEAASSQEDEELFNYDATPITDQDFTDFYDSEEEEDNK